MRILKHILFIVPFFISLLSFGQSFSGLEVTLGVSTTSLRADYLEGIQPSSGFKSGLFIRVPTLPRGCLRSGVLVDIKRFKIKSEDISVSYITLPFHIMLDLGRSKNQIYFGPEANILIDKIHHKSSHVKIIDQPTLGDVTLVTGVQLGLSKRINLSFEGSLGISSILYLYGRPDGRFYSLGTSIGIKL